jgi:hypothetical protein
MTTAPLCGRRWVNNVRFGKLSSPEKPPLSPQPAETSTENLAADCREVIALTARIKVAQSGDLDDPAIAEELRAVEQRWQAFKADRARRQP